MKRLSLLIALTVFSLNTHAAPPRIFTEAKKIAWKIHASESKHISYLAFMLIVYIRAFR